MGLLDFIFGRRVGRIYSMYDVDAVHAKAAEDAVAANRYTVYASHRGHNRGLLILNTTPPLVAQISREPSFTGGAPDMIIQAVYDVDGDPVALARELWALLND